MGFLVGIRASAARIPTQTAPESNADVGAKWRAKVDHAIMKEGKILQVATPTEMVRPSSERTRSLSSEAILVGGRISDTASLMSR